MLSAFRHLIGSTRYSLQGLGVLAQQMAARIEVGVWFGTMLLLAAIGARWQHWLVLSVLFLLMLAVEALNTAIEHIVNRISPEISNFARDAKDLGSAGVFLVVLATCLYLGAVLLGAAGAIDF